VVGPTRDLISPTTHTLSRDHPHPALIFAPALPRWTRRTHGGERSSSRGVMFVPVGSLHPMVGRPSDASAGIGRPGTSSSLFFLGFLAFLE
jgi:hypothetical protein